MLPDIAHALCEPKVHSPTEVAAMPTCCRCNGNGRCLNCSCCKMGKHCLNCRRKNRCRNLPAAHHVLDTSTASRAPVTSRSPVPSSAPVASSLSPRPSGPITSHCSPGISGLSASGSTPPSPPPPLRPFHPFT